MPDMTPAPRRRPLWRLFIMPALLVVAAIAWSGFWFYAASEVGVRAGTDARRVDRPEELDLGWLAGARRIAVTAGASAPDHLVDGGTGSVVRAELPLR